MHKTNVKLFKDRTVFCLFILMFIHWVVTSCNGGTSPKSPMTVYEYKDTIKEIPSPKKVSSQKLDNGKVKLALGKIQQYVGKDKAERNLISQVATYNSALLHGDKQNCAKYLYKDAIVYFRKYYSGFSDDAITDELLQSVSQTYIGQLNKFQEHGIEFSLVVPNLIRKITQGDNIFIVFNITSNICSESLYTHFSDYEQTLGISHNRGKNWSFITMNEDTPNILRISNSEDIIDAIMGY